MSYPKVQVYEHAELGVDDLAAAVEFCTGPLGLLEIEREQGTVYLGCGYDDNYDLALSAGGTGLRHFAIRVPSPDELERLAERLRTSGVRFERRHDAEPGQPTALRFSLPSGHLIEFAEVADTRYIEPYRPARGVNAHAPIDSDHVGLAAVDVRRLAAYLRDELDFRISDYTEPEPGGAWFAAWVRRGPGHHDVGINTASSQRETLHHVAFAYASIDHLKVALDTLSGAGHRLELGLGRHPVGANLYAYLWAPGGNRFELCAEGAILVDGMPPRVWRSISETLDAWGQPAVPETFALGS
jgi:catechol 2,3-dioxygenase